MPPMFRLKARWSGFRNAETGSLSIESIMTLPTLAWALLAMFSYFDGLRQANVNIKAAHTMGDLLSREFNMIDDDYLDGMHDVLKFLTRTPNEPRMRISAVSYDETDEAFTLKWSEVRGGGIELTQDGLDDMQDRLPLAAGGSWLIVVETAVDHEAPFVFGLSDSTLANFVVTRLRFVPELNHEDYLASS